MYYHLFLKRASRNNSRMADNWRRLLEYRYRWHNPTMDRTCACVHYRSGVVLYINAYLFVIYYLFIVYICSSRVYTSTWILSQALSLVSPNINVKVKIITCPLGCLENYLKNYLLYYITLVILKLFYQNYKNL